MDASLAIEFFPQVVKYKHVKNFVVNAINGKPFPSFKLDFPSRNTITCIVIYSIPAVCLDRLTWS